MEDETLEPSPTPDTTLPSEVTVTEISDERFQTLVDSLEEQNKILTEQQELFVEQNELLVGQNEMMQKQLDILSNPKELPPDADYSDYLNQMLGYMADWNDYIVGAGSSLVTYAVFYIPLLVILVALYWFFKQFWTRYT